MDTIASFVGLLILIVGITLGVLLLSGRAFLVGETDNGSGTFVCSYFTGTRVVTMDSGFPTGCPRIIEVGR